ncbi:hypothetical protein ASC95_25910 [Pelomonas sp. Root1217]|nr:hypothetical protein ASC95_25910 [Pelomonas sp. Root1217]
MRRNKYLGFAGSQLDALGQVIVDWPCPAAHGNALTLSPATTERLQPLLDQRLLSQARMPRRTGPLLPEVLDCVDPYADLARPPAAVREVLCLAWAAAGAAFWLRRLSLADIASRVARLRPHSRSTDDGASTAALRDAVSAYMRLRPFLFTAHDKCLHDSLTLIRFLARRGMFPAWVIGVRTRPFAAHSWVQSDGLVLNDVHEHVRTYTPILVV